MITNIVLFILSFETTNTQGKLILSTAATCAWKFSYDSHSLIEEKLCLSLIIQGHIQKKITKKNTGFRLVCSTQSTIFIKLFTKWFPSFSFLAKCSKWEKIFSRSDENITEKLLELETNWILLEKITKLPDKSQEVIQNNGEYSDWNLWINYILLKQKLSLTQPNINQH